MKKDNPRMTLTIRETAETLGLTEKSVYSLIFKRRIPFLKVGRKVLVPLDKLKDFLDANVVNPLKQGKGKDEST